MNIMSFYLNRNTILSNYDTETINWKVYDFGLELSDLIFNRYEEMMMTTTFEKEFKRIYSRNLIEYKNSSYGILVKVNGKKKMVPISEKMVAIVNKRLDEHLLGKMKMYPMIVRELVDSVHSAYLRAWRGLERDSLRTARTVTQSDRIRNHEDMTMVSQPKSKSWNPFTWGG